MGTLTNRVGAFAQAITLGLLVAGFISTAVAGPYDAPAGYYSTVTGTGATLKSQLAAVMSNGHIQRTYGNFRDSASITDQDPNNPNNILLAYNRQSVPSGWDQGTTWNREHTWPQSRQPGSASNGTIGNLGDPHALRPANPQVNGNRGNDPFATASTTGSHGSVGSFYFPGDVDKGDTARQLFYSATRYSGLTLVDGVPSGNQMGDLESLVAWHYLDAPDEFERRRNHTIFSQAENPLYYTNNRNAYVDHPEFVWSVFVDQENDSRLSIAGTTPSSNGSSTNAIDLGRVFVGGAAPSAVSVGVDKNGDDGTYYGVTTTGAAFTDAGEHARPLAIGSGVSDSFDVGLTVSTASSGLFDGSVVIDNLDVTTAGGTGRGANDGDDTIDLSFAVLDHPVASLVSDAIVSATTIDFGSIDLGSGEIEQSLSFFNFDGVGGPAFASDLDLDSIGTSGDAGVLSLDVMPTTGIAQGGGVFFSALFDTSTAGEFESVVTLNLSGEDLPGEQVQTLTVTLVGEVVETALLGDINGDGTVDLLDLDILGANFGENGGPPFLAGDLNGDGATDLLDLDILGANFGQSIGGSAVPEPSAALLACLTAAGLFARRANPSA